jgi:hypothetical protein
MEGKARESQIKNQSCVLVTHFHDVFPEFSTRHSVNDILNTFDFFSNKSDFEENGKILFSNRRECVWLPSTSSRFRFFLVVEKRKNFKSRRREEKVCFASLRGFALELTAA